MLKLLQHIFPTKRERDIRQLLPIVEAINREYEQLHDITDAELRAKTDLFRSIVRERTERYRQEIESLREQLRTQDLSYEERLQVYDRLAKLDEEEYSVIQSTLDELLPQAYAVVKEACRRLAESQYTYEVVGHQVVWDMIPFDVQLMGAIVLHQGKIAEMATGEGKTLVAVMPLYLNALAGRGVHLVTVNDYLARRDAEWMGPVFRMLGVTVGCIQTGMSIPERKRQYECDVTYGTNSEFGFDYLRDNMVLDPNDIVQRGHWYAIVDEVDSILIDEARTPLIISGPVISSNEEFVRMNPRVRRLVEAQTRLINQIVAEAERLLQQNSSKEARERAGRLLLQAHRGLPKHKRLLKLLADGEIKELLHQTELYYLRDQGIHLHELDEELYYTIDEKTHQVDISEKGRQLLAQVGEDPDMFLIPDVGTEISLIEQDPDLTPEEKQRRKDEVFRLYAERSERVHVVNQLLRAYSLYERDVDYVVQDGKVKIVDEFTGRILEGRRYSDGLHQAIEAKEGVTVEQDTQTLATITIQNYFRLYRKLAGMTGTAETEAAEFDKIYGLDVVVIPTNKPVIRQDLDDLVFRTKREKYNAVIQEIQRQLERGRAVLVGTTSVEVSETLSRMLRRLGIPHNVLNAKHHQREAEIIAQAGRKGAVTIATNMAGRGTDIKLDPEVRAAGGLAVIGTERHEARRIDRQLRGRAGRQGDPGTSQFFVSLEDDLLRLFGGPRIAAIMQKLKVPEGEPIQHPMITKAIERAQKKVEEQNFAIRKRLLEYDNVMNQQREIIYDRRRHALLGERLKGEIFQYIRELAEDWYATYHPEGDLEGLKNTVRATLLCEPAIRSEEFREMSKEECVERVLQAAQQFYQRKEALLGPEFMAQLERFAVLATIDEKWREHLRAMDELREAIHLRAYGQKDPLLEYKAEAYRLFVQLIKEINREAVHFVFKYFPPVLEQAPAMAYQQPAVAPPSLRLQQRIPSSALQFSHPEVTSSVVPAGVGAAQAVTAGVVTKPSPVVNTMPRVGRNDPCPCGSGKKYKHCHGRNA
ncbi:MAG: preprotein translocase subunit SecA [Candidatus Kapabacteria bacterium]|nr:preprotein translocase subunit SecA [Candidatus Kapabacteria bacterium]MDW8011764.1 preprotein translocase subunit SecA [Bacteroidota bacterium]